MYKRMEKKYRGKAFQKAIKITATTVKVRTKEKLRKSKSKRLMKIIEYKVPVLKCKILK